MLLSFWNMGYFQCMRVADIGMVKSFLLNYDQFDSTLLHRFFRNTLEWFGTFLHAYWIEKLDHSAHSSLYCVLLSSFSLHLIIWRQIYLVIKMFTGRLWDHKFFLLNLSKRNEKYINCHCHKVHEKIIIVSIILTKDVSIPLDAQE